MTSLLSVTLQRVLVGPRLFALLLCLLAGHANALCTATCSCGVTTTNVQFPNYNPLSASNDDTTGTIKVTCGGVAGLAIPYRIDITKGNGTSYAARRMNWGANLLSYNLYLDSNYTQVWGDGSSSTQYATGSILLDVLGSSAPVTHTVYGRIPASQTGVAPGGPYLDAISVTLTYF